MNGRPIKFTFSITVSGGVGSTPFSIPITNGVVCYNIAIDGPDGATYSFLIKDSELFVVAGASDVYEDSTHYVQLPLQDSAKFEFKNSTDGVYRVRIWALLGR